MSATYFEMHSKYRWIDGCTEGWIGEQIYDKANLEKYFGIFGDMGTSVHLICFFNFTMFLKIFIKKQLEKKNWR